MGDRDYPFVTVRRLVSAQLESYGGRRSRGFATRIRYLARGSGSVCVQAQESVWFPVEGPSCRESGYRKIYDAVGVDKADQKLALFSSVSEGYFSGLVVCGDLGTRWYKFAVYSGIAEEDMRGWLLGWQRRRRQGDKNGHYQRGRKCEPGQVPIWQVSLRLVLHSNCSSLAGSVGASLSILLEVGRNDLTIRMSRGRFTRLTNTFSTEWGNHCHAMARCFACYNFCRPHWSLENPYGLTPVMAAPVTDRVYNVEWLSALVTAVFPRTGPRGTLQTSPAEGC